jgi:hypothetical protein
MAVDKKISQLASGAPAQAGDEYVVARSGANYKLTLTNIAASMPATTITSGNLTFSSTAQRITGDFSNATPVNRPMFQSSTTNGYTVVRAIPNGTSQYAEIGLGNNSDQTAATSTFFMSLSATEARIASSQANTGTLLPLTFQVGGSERVRIDTSGNVGIGTASTGFNSAGLPLVVGSGSGNTGMTIYSGTASSGSIHFGDTVTTGADGYRGFLNYTHNTNSMQFGTDATTRMTIDSSGNVGIGGTADARSKLQITGTLPSDGGNSLPVVLTGTIPSGTTSQAQIFRSNPTTQATSFTLSNLSHFVAGSAAFGAGSTVVNQYGFWATNQITNATNNYGFYSDIASGSNRWNFYAAGTAENYFAGNTGIGAAPGGNGRLVVSQPANNVTTAGFFSTGSGDVGQRAVAISKHDNDSTTSQVFVQFAINNNGIASGQINANGANSAAFGTWSDARLKENIVDLPPQLANICALRPVEFDYKTGGHQIGFIAQEMQKVYADAVGENKDGMLTITGWSKTEARLVKAIQELTARVAELEAK